jgi:hypothetical protein
MSSLQMLFLDGMSVWGRVLKKDEMKQLLFSALECNSNANTKITINTKTSAPTILITKSSTSSTAGLQLKTLQLQHFDFTRLDLVHLFESLRHNTSLERLDLCGSMVKVRIDALNYNTSEYHGANTFQLNAAISTFLSNVSTATRTDSNVATVINGKTHTTVF